MTIGESLLPEFEQELANTRKILERVPERSFGWKPHAKSAEFGKLATHVAMLPGWTTVTLTTDSLDVTQPFDAPNPRTNRELLEIFDKEAAAAKRTLATIPDSEMMKSWALMNGPATIFSMPRVAVLRSFVMNHLIHHRAQLGVYLRLNDVPVPGVYGPSADETAF